MNGISTCMYCLKPIFKSLGVWYHSGTNGATYCYEPTVATPIPS